MPVEFELIGTPANYHPAASHWGLGDLQHWHNRIYLAHGDWIRNTGPVRLIYLDLETGTLVHDEGFVADEEALEIFRVFNDTLYAPGIDPRESPMLGNLYLKPWGQSWLKRRSIPSAVHVWDVARLGRSLIAVGRAIKNNLAFGAVWVSTDSGQSWQEGPDFQTDGYGEATSLFVLADRAYATTVGTGCLAFDGDGWEEADCVPSSLFEASAHVHKNAWFEGTVAMAPYRCVDNTRLYLFDGTRRWTVDFGEPVRDVVSTEGGLLVLTGVPSGKGSIFHAASLDCRCEQDFVRLINLDMSEGTPPVEVTRAEACSSLGHTPQSLEYVQGRFYIGLADGRLFRSIE
ncbi:MAG: hypothetical protein ACUVWZ_00480 [Anaerolineae bacterium]